MPEYRISLTPDQERVLHQAYLTRPANIRIPAHIVLLLHRGYTPEKIAEITYTAVQDVEDAVRTLQVGGIAAIINPK